MAIVALLAMQASPAAGHPQFALSTVNRYTKLVLLPRGQVRLIYTLMVGDVPALALRRQADRDHDGHLSQDESAALARDLAARARQGLAATLDGRRDQPQFEEPVIGLAGNDVAPSAFSVDLVAVLRAPSGGTHELRYEDRNVVPPVGEVEVLLEESPGVRLLSANQGAPRADQQERTTQFRFYGSASLLADRSVSLRFAEQAPRAEQARRTLPLWALGLGLVVLLGGATAAWRRARRRASAG